MPGTSLSAHVVRVFTDDHGDHGNALGVIVDGPALPAAADRQELAFELGFSETVFLDDPAAAELQIFTPSQELPLAGHPLVGTAWLLNHLGTPVTTLRPRAGEVACGADAGSAWIEADPELGPPWALDQRLTIDEIDAIDAEAWRGTGWDYVWAWLDEAAGLVRARSFVQEDGIDEDEATGSAALRLCAALARPITIHQGRGSRIDARPVEHGLVRVGGRVAYDEELLLDA